MSGAGATFTDPGQLFFRRGDAVTGNFPLGTLGDTGLLAQSLAANAILAGLADAAL